MQVSGRGALTFSERLALELEYIEHFSLWRDFVILAQTLPVVTWARGRIDAAPPRLVFLSFGAGLLH